MKNSPERQGKSWCRRNGFLQMMCCFLFLAMFLLLSCNVLADDYVPLSIAPDDKTVRVTVPKDTTIKREVGSIQVEGTVPVYTDTRSYIGFSKTFEPPVEATAISFEIDPTNVSGVGVQVRMENGAYVESGIREISGGSYSVVFENLRHSVTGVPLQGAVKKLSLRIPIPQEEGPWTIVLKNFIIER